jgi:hypothetical protein
MLLDSRLDRFSSRLPAYLHWRRVTTTSTCIYILSPPVFSDCFLSLATHSVSWPPAFDSIHGPNGAPQPWCQTWNSNPDVADSGVGGDHLMRSMHRGEVSAPVRRLQVTPPPNIMRKLMCKPYYIRSCNLNAGLPVQENGRK